jgi:pantetheine-phosphate adenylyltransferase
MISVVYPGTFDPPHLGHLDIVRRSCELFDRVVVAIAKSPRKYLLFNLEERVDMFRVMVEPLGPKVEVKGFDGLLVDFMMPSQEYIHISSTIVRDIASYCGTLEGLVHPYVAKKLREKFNCP